MSTSPRDGEIPPFETTLAVPLACESCVQSVTAALHALGPCIHSVSARLPDQVILVTGTAAPSAIVQAVQETGRDAILRGSGRGADEAAVCILETHAAGAQRTAGGRVKGLVRMVQVAPNMTVADIALSGVRAGSYAVTVRENGDVSGGAETTGTMWGWADRTRRGAWGTIQVGPEGLGSVFIDRPVEIWEVIGRSIVVSQKQDHFDKQDEDTLVGVIARSAGIWDNDKTVCSCSGKTVWEERKEQRGKGML